jgi:hypothetical protein
MSLPALATAQGVQARDIACSSSAARVQAAIDDASALIHNHTGNRWVLDGAIDPTMPPVVTTIAYRVIRRALANPDDLESETHEMGPFRSTRQFGAGDTFLTNDEKETLTGSLGNTSGLSVVRTSAPWAFSRPDVMSELYEDEDT